MKKFSNKWKASKRPAKQRKYNANLPIHMRKKLVSVNLSKELRKKLGKRNIAVKKGQLVKIMRGKFKKKQGKVQSVDLKKLKITVEGIQVKKQDGSKANFPLKPSNLQIIRAETEESKEEKKTDKKDLNQEKIKTKDKQK
jgi:large subunit ribosomal protein L24